MALAESPDGRAVAWIRSDVTGDSILVDRVSLAGWYNDAPGRGSSQTVSRPLLA